MFKGATCKNFAVKYPKTTRSVLYICSLEYLQYPKCLQLFVNREKIAILTNVPERVRSRLSIASYPRYPRFPVLFCRNHGNTKDALIYYMF